MAIDPTKISKGRSEKPPRVVVYGPSGVGKTRFACSAPDVFVIDADKGSHYFDTTRVVPDSWKETKEWVNAVETGEVKCKTLVIDSITALENMSHAELFPDSTIHDNYGKGETVAVMAWREFLLSLERVWDKGIGIILVGHMSVKTFNDPTGPAYDRFELACRPRLAGLITFWSDYVLMAREEVMTHKDGQKSKAVTSGARWAHMRRSPAYEAKARGTSSLFPEKVPLNWESFATAIKQDSARYVEFSKEIDVALAEISDEIYADRVLSYLKDQPEKIVEIKNKVLERLNNVRAAREVEK